jgi:hypothetical protein
MSANTDADDNPTVILERLMALEYTLVEAYQAAIEGVSERYRPKLENFKADHERQIRDMEPVVRQLGGEPPTGPGGSQLLTQSQKPVSDLVGDQAILLAVKTKEEDAEAAYAHAMNVVPAQADDVLARGRASLHHHQDWSSAILSELSASASYQGVDQPPKP